MSNLFPPQSVFAFCLARLLTLGILFLTKANAVIVAKPEIVGILLSMSVILAL